MSESRKIDGVEYEIIAEQEDGGGDYEWSQVALVRDPAGQLYLVDDCGCSCNGPWDNVCAGDLTRVPTWQAAIDKLKADRPWHFTDDDVAAFAQKLMKLRPAPSPR